MSCIAILGAGNGGLAAAAELGQRGYSIRLWNRGSAVIDALRARGGRFTCAGLPGDGQCTLGHATTELAEALDGADGILVCLPTIAHRGLAGALAALGSTLPIVLNPGHTGGALEFRAVFAEAGRPCPPLAELSTLAYVARRPEPLHVNVTGVAAHLWVASLGEDPAALALAQVLYPVAEALPDVIGTGLANVNMILHPPGAITAAAWVEATGGDFLFYVDAMTGGVGRLIAGLDAERLAVAAAFGHRLPPLIEEMRLIGTVEQDSPAAADAAGIAAAIRAGRANRAIRGPDSLQHRYYLEDFWYGLMPLLALARIAGTAAPITASLLGIASALVEPAAQPPGRSADLLGLAGMGLADVIHLTRGNNAHAHG